MRIRRLSIINEKLFSRQDGLRYLSTFCDKVCIGVIKLVELYELDRGNNIKHWMNSIVSSAMISVINSGKEISNVYISSPQFSFIKAIESSFTISRVLGNDFLEYCNSGIGKIYIKNLCKEILEMTQRNEKKYVDAIKQNGGFLVSPKDYILLFKYIALCLSGQIDYKNFDLWSDINFIVRMNVNYSINRNYSINELKRIIANCIFQFKGNVPDSGENILKFL